MEESSKEKKALFPAKGKRGYLKGKKLKNLLIVILFIGLIAGLMITGILITGNKKNIFTIMAILNVLPMAHFLTALIAAFPYKSPALDEYESVCTGKEDAMLTEIIVTSPKLKAAELSYVCINDDNVYAYSPSLPGSKKEYEEYIEGLLAVSKMNVSFHIYTELTAFKKVSKHSEGQKLSRFEEDVYSSLKSVSM